MTCSSYRWYHSTQKSEILSLRGMQWLGMFACAVFCKRHLNSWGRSITWVTGWVARVTHLIAWEMSEGQWSTQVLSVLKSLTLEQDVQLLAYPENSLQLASHAVQVEASASCKNSCEACTTLSAASLWLTPYSPQYAVEENVENVFESRNLFLIQDLNVSFD